MFVAKRLWPCSKERAKIQITRRYFVSQIIRFRVGHSQRQKSHCFDCEFMDSKDDLSSIRQNHSLEPTSTKQCRTEIEMLIEVFSVTYFWVKLDNSNFVSWCHDEVINEFLNQKQDTEIINSQGKIRLPYFTNGLRAKCCIRYELIRVGWKQVVGTSGDVDCGVAWF